MFGLKADWSVDVQERYFTLENYASEPVRLTTVKAEPVKR